MSSIKERTEDPDTYTVHEMIEDLEGLYSSNERLYSSQISDDEFNTLDAMNQLRQEYTDNEHRPDTVDRIAGENNWNELERLLSEAVDEGLLGRETKKIDLPSETYPRKNLFYSFESL